MKPLPETCGALLVLRLGFLRDIFFLSPGWASMSNGDDRSVHQRNQRWRKCLFHLRLQMVKDFLFLFHFSKFKYLLSAACNIITFTPNAKLPFKVAPGNFNYNGNTSYVWRISYATSNKFFCKVVTTTVFGKEEIHFYRCYNDIWVCHSNLMTSRSIVFHGHWRFFWKSLSRACTSNSYLYDS